MMMNIPFNTINNMVMDTVMEPKKKKATLTDMVIHMDLIIYFPKKSIK
jgi:hypothetical protein